MVARPEDYPWSSYRSNAMGVDDGLTQPHENFLALSSSTEERQQRYTALFEDEMGRRELVQIRRGVERCGAVGNPEFLLKVARLTPSL